jgi:hypothetical protein
MLTIKFGRYIPTLKVYTNNEGVNYNVFKSIIDHEITRMIDILPIQRALNMSRIWLNNHFGFVMIYYENQNEEDNEHFIRLCNYKKFVKTMRVMNVKIQLENRISK